MIFLQSALITLVAAFLLFVSFFAWKTDRKLKNLVQPVSLPPQPSVATIGMSESESRSGQPHNTERQSEEPFNFYRLRDGQNKRTNQSGEIPAQCQLFLYNLDFVESVKNTLNINGISILYLIEFLPYNMIQSIIYIFHLDCQDYIKFINIFRSMKLVSVPLYLYFIYRVFLQK